MPTQIDVVGMRKGLATDTGVLQVVDDVSLQVGDGEFIAIVGPSGCGKSTLMQMIAGFMPPDSGRVDIDGVTRHRPSPEGILISQHGSVFPWLTVRENLMFGLNDEKHAGDKTVIADHYAGIVSLEGFSYPHELSGGMLKRVEIARALAVKPHILFMDEPFSALDALTSLRMRNELLRILAHERHTVILITHDVEEAIHLADRIMVLSSCPTRIQKTFQVELTHPRRLTSPSVQQLRVEILGELGVPSQE